MTVRERFWRWAYQRTWRWSKGVTDWTYRRWANAIIRAES